MKVPALVGCVCLVLSSRLPAQIVFGPAQLTPLPGTALPRVAVGDVDGDGFADVVVGHTGAPGLRLGDGAGHLGPEAPIDTDAAGETVALADMNGDGRLDLLVGSSATSQLAVALASRDGGYEPSLVSTLGGLTLLNKLSLDVRDADGDGDVDVLAVTPAPDPGASNGDGRLFRNIDGEGHLGLVAVFPGGEFQPKLVSGLIGDLNGDGRPDVVLLTNQGSPSYWTRAWLCQPDASFVLSWSAPAWPYRLADLDGDGDLDLLMRPLGPPPYVELRTMLNAGDGTFSEGPSPPFHSE